MTREFRVIWPRLAPEGALLADDCNSAVLDRYSSRIGVPSRSAIAGKLTLVSCDICDPCFGLSQTRLLICGNPFVFRGGWASAFPTHRYGDRRHTDQPGYNQ